MVGEGQDRIGPAWADFLGRAAEPASPLLPAPAPLPDAALRVQFDQMMRVDLTVEGGESLGATSPERVGPDPGLDDKRLHTEGAQTPGVWSVLWPYAVPVAPPTVVGRAPVAEVPTPTPTGLSPLFRDSRAPANPLGDERSIPQDSQVTVLPSTAPHPVRSDSVSAPAAMQAPMAPLQSRRVEDVPAVIVDRAPDPVPVQTPRQEEPDDRFQIRPSLDTRKPDLDTPSKGSDDPVPQVLFASDPLPTVLPTAQVSPPTPAAPPERSPPSTAAAISDWLQQAVTRLQVGEGADGNQEVRFDIRPEVLPGVRVVLHESNGRVQVDFICSVDASRHVLSEIAQREASEMARRCRRDLLLRVQSEDEDSDLDPALRLRPIEVLGIA